MEIVEIEDEGSLIAVTIGAQCDGFANDESSPDIPNGVPVPSRMLQSVSTGPGLLPRAETTLPWAGGTPLSFRISDPSLCHWFPGFGAPGLAAEVTLLHP